MSAATEPDWEAELADLVGQFTHDPRGFVLTMFPWGEPGTSLEHEWPDDWQVDDLDKIGKKLRDNPHMPLLSAVAAANGVGKTAELAWLFWWAMCTHEDTRGRVTAGTKAQLSQATHAEISKWHQLLLCKHWFNVTAEKVCAVEKGKDESWSMAFVPWSKHRPDAFQGLHNKRKRLVFIVDEASGVDDIIHEAIEGSLTDKDTEIFVFLRSNPMRREGRMFKVMTQTGPMRDRWVLRHVDGRESKNTNKEQIEAWRLEHGEDSDFFRVRVRGIFPKRSIEQFISEEDVKAARRRPALPCLGDPLIIGCDVARQGNDHTRISFRRGLDARTIPSIKIPFDDSEGYLMQLASKLLELKNLHAADAIIIDATGIGWGVVDRLKQMRVSNVHAIGFGDKPLDCWKQTIPFALKNRKIEIWAALKYWLPFASIEDIEELEIELTGPKRYYDLNGVMFLEYDDKLPSPDWATSLACTFGVPVAKGTKEEGADRLSAAKKRAQEAQGGRQPTDNNPFAGMDMGD